MRSLSAIAAFACALAIALPADARPKVSVKTEYYRVKGKTGDELLRQINRKGPRHGFLVRAIAQTQYTLSYGYETVQTEKDCRMKDVEVKLDIVYVYPQVKGNIPRELNGRWKRFISGVTAHEQVHGKLARQMAAATEKVLAATRVSGKHGCRHMKRVAERKAAKVFKEYERKQVAFDRKEHRDGGNVDKLVIALVKK